MSVRIFLNKAGEKALTKTDRQKWGKDLYLLELVEIVLDDVSGEKFSAIDVNPFDPAVIIPRIARKYIKRVTIFGQKYFEGFRTDGIYKLKGATAKVETIENHSRPYNDHDSWHSERYQTISISAGSIKTLREIYTKIRQGALKPDEDWGVSLSEIQHREAARPASETSVD